MRHPQSHLAQSGNGGLASLLEARGIGRQDLATMRRRRRPADSSGLIPHRPGGARADFLSSVEELRWLLSAVSLLAGLHSLPLSCISTSHSPGLLVSSQAGSRNSCLKGKKMSLSLSFFTPSQLNLSFLTY